MYDKFNRKLKVTCLSSFGPVLICRTGQEIISCPESGRTEQDRTGRTKLMLCSSLPATHPMIKPPVNRMMNHG